MAEIKAPRRTNQDLLSSLYGQLEAVHMRNFFYRRAYERAMTAAIFIAAGLVIVAGIAWIAVFNQRPPLVIAAKENGQIIPIMPLDNPILSDAELRTWAVNAITRSLSMDFQNYRQVLEDVRPYFTNDGYQSFLETLQRNRILDAIKENVFVMSCVAQAAPVIEGAGLLNGTYSWKIELPVLVTYQSSNNRESQNMIATVLVTRASEISHPQGVAIRQFVAVNR